MATPQPKQLDLPSEPTSRVLAWEAPEFLHYEKSFQWSVIIWIVALLLTAGALWYYKLTFLGILSAIVPLAAALALTNQGRVRPNQIRIAISDDGVTINDQAYPWGELKSFWLVVSAFRQTLYLESTRRFLPILALQLGKVDPEAVRSFLLEHLPERTDRQEELNDRLARYFRF